MGQPQQSRALLPDYQANAIPCRDISYGKRKYLHAWAFEGVCGEALADLGGQPAKQLFDALLVDEAQDFGPNFFKLAHATVRPPKRFVWAHDELQSLRETSVPGLAELFGTDAEAEPLVKLRNIESQPQQDVILPKCYRNTPWALSTAHALGFGIYRKDGLIQMFNEPALWSDIGYEAVKGTLDPGAAVTLARRDDASPDFFARLLTPEDAVQFRGFGSEKEQVEWVSDESYANIRQDELEPSDILVIFANPVTAAADAGPLIALLRKRGINAHIAGVTRDLDEFFIPDSVAVSGIYRAKGNEAPMVYVLNSEYCHSGWGLIRRRNTLFTAVTRSKAWVRVCGVGPDMQQLIEEWKTVHGNNYNLRFKVPTDKERDQLRKIHRDRTQDEIQLVESSTQSLREVVERLETEEMTLEDIPRSLRAKLAAILGKK